MAAIATPLGSAGCQPVPGGSLPKGVVLGKLPSTAGWQPALSREYSVAERTGISTFFHDE